MPFAKCKWYEDDGTPRNGGCRRIGSGCDFVHPMDPNWNAARPPPFRPGDKPFHGRKNDSAIPTTGTNPSTVDSGWGSRRGRGGPPTAPRALRMANPSPDIGGGASSGGGSGWTAGGIPSSTPNEQPATSTASVWDTIGTTVAASAWGDADTTTVWGSTSGDDASGGPSSSNIAPGWGSWGAPPSSEPTKEPAASSNNNITSDWGASSGTAPAGDGWVTEDTNGSSGATTSGGWDSTLTVDKITAGSLNTEPNGLGSAPVRGAPTSSSGATQQSSVWGTDPTPAAMRNERERATTEWSNSGTDGGWVMEEATPIVTSMNDIATLPKVVLSPLHTPEDIGNTELPSTSGNEDIDITSPDLAAVTESLPDCILDTDSGDPYMQYIKTLVKSVLYYYDYENAKAVSKKHEKLQKAPRHTQCGPRGQEILKAVGEVDNARCENDKKNRDDAVRRLQELTMLMDSSSIAMTHEEVAEIKRYTAQTKDWLRKVRNTVEGRGVVIAQDEEAETVWNKLIQSMNDFEERISNLYHFHDDIRGYDGGDVIESMETRLVEELFNTYQSKITRIRHEVDSIRARDIEEQQNSELDAIRTEQEAYRRSIAELEASSSKAAADLDDLLDGAAKATRNLESLQIPTETRAAALIHYENLAREIAENEFNFVSVKLKEAVRERLDVESKHIVDAAWQQLQPMMQFTIRISEALDKAKEDERACGGAQSALVAET